MWCERAYRSFSCFGMGKGKLSVSVGAQLLLSPFCCGKRYSITTWELREAKTHTLLQPLELCNNHRNLLCAPWSPWLTFLVAPTTAATYPVFVTSHNLLVPFSYCEQTPGLPLSHRDRRKKAASSPAFSFEFVVLFLMGWPISLAILALKAPSRKTKLLLEIPSEGYWPASQTLISQVSPLTISISSTSTPAFPPSTLGRGFCLLNKEKCCEARGSGPILVTLLSQYHLLTFFGKFTVRWLHPSA